MLTSRRAGMVLETVFRVTPGLPGLGDIGLPLRIEPDAGIQLTLDDPADELRITVRRAVPASQLELVLESGRHRELPDGTHEPLPRVRLLNDEPPERFLVDDFVSALTFLTD